MRLDKLLADSKHIRSTLELMDEIKRIKNAHDFIHVHAYVVHAYWRTRPITAKEKRDALVQQKSRYLKLVGGKAS